MRPGGQPNMQQLMKQAQKMQQELLAAQQELADTEVTGSAGGGLVTATVTGASELKSRSSTRAWSTRRTSRRCRTWSSPRSGTPTGPRQELAGQRMGPLTQGMGGLGLPGM